MRKKVLLTVKESETEFVHECEVDSTNLSQGENLHILVSLLSRCCTWIDKVTSGYI